MNNHVTVQLCRFSLLQSGALIAIIAPDPAAARLVNCRGASPERTGILRQRCWARGGRDDAEDARLALGVTAAVNSPHKFFQRIVAD